jgi:hypothetical protein
MTQLNMDRNDGNSLRRLSTVDLYIKVAFLKVSIVFCINPPDLY